MKKYFFLIMLRRYIEIWRCRSTYSRPGLHMMKNGLLTDLITLTPFPLHYTEKTSDTRWIESWTLDVVAIREAFR